MMRIVKWLPVALLFSASAALAETAPAGAGAEPAVPEDERSEIEMATCGDLFELFAEATPEEGRDPAAVARAQDDVLYFVTWVHGYLSGMHGIDEKKRPMGKEGIEHLIDEMAKVCEPDEARLFLDAVKELN